MPSTLDKIRAILRKPAPTAAQLGTALDDARGAELAAREAVERQAAAVATDILDDAAARQASRAKLADLRIEAEDAAAVLAEATRRRDAAVAEEQEGRRRFAYEQARERADAVASTLVKRYSEAAGALVGLLRDIADANAQVRAANADLPDAAREIPLPETVVRATPGLSHLPDEVETIERWAFADGSPVVDVYLKNVANYGNGRGSYKTMRVDGLDDVEAGQEVTLRRFQKITSYEATPGVYLTDLARSIRLPELYADRNIIGSNFPPDTWTADADLVGRADHAFATMVKPAEASKADRPRRVELRPVWTDAEVQKANAPATDYHDRAVRPATGSRFGASPFAKPGARAGGRR